MKDKVMQTQILILEYFLSSQESDSIKERNKIKMTLSTIWGHSKLEYLGGMDTEQLKFIISRIETKHYRRSANSTHLSERTSLYPPSLGALPPHSPERQKEPQAMVSLQHHRRQQFRTASTQTAETWHRAGWMVLLHSSLRLGCSCM